MPDQIVGSFGGRQIQVAAQEAENFADAGLDPSVWMGKANSYCCPIGEEPGVGYLLMLRSDLDALGSTSAYFPLIFGTGTNTVTFPSMIFKQAYRILPGASQDPDALYLVEVTDKRWLCQQGFVEHLGYNLIEPNAAADGYTTQSQNGGSPWTWDAVVQDLWGKVDSALIGAYTSQFPGISALGITSTPENLVFDCVSPWHALCEVCRRLGCQVRYDPIADVFQIVQMGNGVADTPVTVSTITFNNQGGVSNGGFVSAAATTRAATDGLLEDAETYPGNYIYPAKVRVCFRREWDESDAFPQISNAGTFYSVAVTGASLGIGTAYTAPAGGQFSGTTAILHDGAKARFKNASDTTPTNSANLITRAQEVATDYYRSLIDDTIGRLVFSGIQTVIPNPTIGEVCWRDFGDGFKTEIRRAKPILAPQVEDPPIDEHWNLVRGTLASDLTDLPATALLNCQRWSGSGWASTGRQVTVRSGMPFTGTIKAGKVAWAVKVCGQYFAIIPEC